MEELSGEIIINDIDRFVDYCNNYTTEIIQGKHAPSVFKAFDNNNVMQSHLISMWVKQSQTYDGRFGMFKMFSLLDHKTKEIFINWILNNYKS